MCTFVPVENLFKNIDTANVHVVITTMKAETIISGVDE